VASLLSLAAADIIDVASTRPELSTFVSLVNAANLTETLNTTSGITVFAPNDDSFANLQANYTNQLMAQHDQLRNEILYHVHPAILAVTDFMNDALISTMDGNNTIRTNVYNVTSGKEGYIKVLTIVFRNCLHCQRCKNRYNQHYRSKWSTQRY
jgi:uncharacterized surface protein with fasciclin (FAS1) repeats